MTFFTLASWILYDLLREAKGYLIEILHYSMVDILGMNRSSNTLRTLIFF